MKETMSKAPSVCIIGAGVSGLRCAEVLAGHGFEVTIFEARNRVGGRVHQESQNGHLIDIGPNWIHGTDRNPILDLAIETETATNSIGEDSAVYDEHGNLIQDKSKATELSGIVWGIIADAFKYSNESSSIPPERSLLDFFHTELEQKHLSDGDKKLVIQMAHMWGAFIGDPIHKQSLKFLWMEESIDGAENLFVSGTYRAILQRVAAKALSNATLHLSAKVTSVECINSSSATRTTVYTDAFAGSSFDATILTVPLGCLKACTPAIEPPLPVRIQSAVHNLSYGNLEKVYITFPKAFWNPEGGTAAYASFNHFLQPKYDAQHNPEACQVECMALSTLSDSSAHPTLLFYIIGALARSIATSPSFHQQSTSQQPCNPAICKAFEPYYSRLPGYDAADPKCVPVGAMATAWSADPYAGWGSYSNFQVLDKKGMESEKEKDDEIRLDKDVEVLREGCPERGLWFAGEHTAPFVALGTVTGAYLSGEQVANRVVAWFEGRETDGAVEASGPEDSGDGTVQMGKALGGGGVGGLERTN